MKKNILLLILIVMTSLANAQNSTNLSGHYDLGSSSPEGGSHLFVLENGDYAIAYFGGVQTGKWKKEGDNIYRFSPNIKASKFELFGRYNKDLKSNTKISFNGFENARTFVQLRAKNEEEYHMQPVFNEGANCFSYPYLYTFKNIAQSITFSFGDGSKPGRSVITIQNPDKFNDFIANFIEIDSDEARPFLVKFKDNKLYFGEDNYAVRNALNEDDDDVQLIKTLIKNESKRDTIYLNPWYNLFGEPDSETDVSDISEHYIFNEQKNAYIDNEYYVEGIEYTGIEESFEDMSILYLYRALVDVNEKHLNYKITDVPLFEVRCD